MSIVVGKRNFAENFSQMMISDFPRDNLYRSKMVMNETNLLNRNNLPCGNQSQMFESVKTLKQYFPQIVDQELFTVLEDCDNNLEIAIEILEKSTQRKINIDKPQQAQGRTVRKIQAAKEVNKNQIAPQIEERKVESIQEEEPAPNTNNEEIRNLSATIIDRLQTLSTMDEAKDLLARVLCEVKNDTEKKDNEVIRKLQHEKSILIKAFAKQRSKALVHEEKNQELNILLNTHEQEIAKLKTLNYKLGLRLKSLDSYEGVTHNFDIY